MVAFSYGLTAAED